jgi:hypothetical protein
MLVVTCRAKQSGLHMLCVWRDWQFMLGYFRVLCFLVFVDLLELCLRFADVHAVCNSPEVSAARNMSNYTGMTAEGCETFSNV